MFAVIDFETTGFSPYRGDRIVELAIVVLDENGIVVKQLESVVNPDRDVGATRIHKLRAKDLHSAPKFHELLPFVFDCLRGAKALVAHNLKFDIAFLEMELGRVGLTLPSLQGFCTMQMGGGGSLSHLCTQHGISYGDDAHAAMADAMATAKLWNAIVSDEPSILAAANGWDIPVWPVLEPSQVTPLSRRNLKTVDDPGKSFLQRLLPSVESEPDLDNMSSAVLAYSTLLVQVLEDREIDSNESEALVEVALKWSLSRREIKAAHEDFLRRVEIAALADGVITDMERQDIHRVASLLGLPCKNLDELVNQASEFVTSFKSGGRSHSCPDTEAFNGKNVCFTGEFETVLNGQLVTREFAIKLAEKFGLVAQRSVTKKLDFLVAADPLSLSGKACKARTYGIPILSEKEFFQKLGIGGLR
jgi:DNA polymerase III subunit epsilon